MSFEKMISLHPDVAGNVNEALAAAVRHTAYCAGICASCADACSAEAMDMRQCIRTCMDCADICAATHRLALRRTGSNEAVLKASLLHCAMVCDACAEECARHQHEHCRLCSDMCRECAADCRAAARTIPA